MRIVSRDRWFETRHFYNGISLIHGSPTCAFYRCNMACPGPRERDVLGSGSGLVSLREQLPFTARPLLAVASHTTSDHIAGHHEFAERLAHPAEGGDPRRAGRRQHPGARLCRRRDVRGASGVPAVLRRIPGASSAGDPTDRRRRRARSRRPRATGAAHAGHSPGGISLWEAATQTLFSGDIVYDGPLVEDAYHSNLDDYATSLARACASYRYAPCMAGISRAFPGSVWGNDRRLVQGTTIDRPKPGLWPAPQAEARASGFPAQRRCRAAGAGVARRFPPGWVACAGARSGQGRHRVATPGFAARFHDGPLSKGRRIGRPDKSGRPRKNVDRRPTLRTFHSVLGNNFTAGNRPRT